MYKANQVYNHRSVLISMNVEKISR